ncbi:4Fe-4S binding protein [Peptoniphilus sp. MSJ-1]|uniref:4Fe-4S binding protein n=1 Tax=Peptoniphilus ovalis TaxID=2841503 RepID=A0ABS6FF51_9FIRM|nr:4Fe-4S binding protein [Peptoniphilus ovalis]MBU5668819.1 4Fe-4S binding protein [Peptoniphilus ovalis]
MDKIFSFLRSKRNFVQGIFALITNGKLDNFLKGNIYTGKLKSVCVPGLNCYSCPGALGSCPIGSFQAVVGSSKYNFSYYITGLLLFFGTIFGRLICGFLCPFGFFQDLVHKIPSKKFSTKRFKLLKYLKYIILVLVVWIFGMIFTDNLKIASPYFCKYICPQGILEGAIPLSIANSGIRAILGKLFTFKFTILLIITISSIFIYRPFCKFLCPLGAFYALTNKFSFYQYYVSENKCISCGKCKRTCKMDVDITKCQKDLECIRCGECIKACPTNAISTSFKNNAEDVNEEYV